MKSKYEVEFSKYPSTELVEQYRGINIYSYESNGMLLYAFWFGEKENEHFSAIKSVDETFIHIDNYLRNC